MRYPYERFIRFLVSRKLDPSDTLTGYGLPPVGPLWLNDYRKELRNTAPAAITGYVASDAEWLTFTNGVIEWAEEEGFKELWESQPEFDGKVPKSLETAHLIFQNPSSRALVGMMLLSKSTDDEIISMVKEKLDIEMDDESLGVYCDIFWDVEMLGRQGWDSFISHLESKEERHYLALGLNSPTNEECRNTVDLDNNLDLDLMLKEILNKSFFKLKDAYDHPNPNAANIDLWHGHWQKAWDRTVKRQAEADGANPIATGDYAALFSVQPTKSTHTSLADIKGHLSATATQAAADADKKEES